MDFKSKYVPKERKRVNYKIVVPFILLLGLLFYAVYDLYKPTNQETDNHFSICRTDFIQTQELLSNLEHQPPIDLNDYGIYGQTLGLYNKPYTIHEQDPFDGKTVFLNNLCKNEESVYMMNVDLDNKIPMEMLEDGFYQIKILEGLKQLSLRTDNKIDDVFYSVSKDGYSKKIRMIADMDLFNDDSKKVMNDNYVFLEVSSVETPKDNIDIVIDPVGLVEDENGNIDYGGQRSDIIESKEMYRTAEGIKTQLEAKGLTVMIARDDSKPKSLNGSDGRLKSAYDVGAKYYIQLRFPNSSYEGDKGTTIMYSNFTSNKLATNIMKNIMNATSLKPSIWSSGRSMDGVYHPEQIEGYDSIDSIREAGGRFTGAGTMDETYRELNQFASKSNKGMQSIVIEYGFMNDDRTFNTWKQEHSKIVDATVSGILAELGYSK
ncbi:N-acetylmuramoyl-L-alanine amidase [Erysipelothrix enhydrae]|uniref:N-acetylmuramoyl-L-alanine amidase n=1 Tax=Erysipelothrix enhydrae TaxID=2890314 RepID=UPI002B24009B|nr:N-acetylmuramoyl-L-alanine amidase [Erysipelothrix sp. 4322-04]WRB87012.1 N-acetylmuramoyl-L-alanine amidase [Erysipelothrix sp. 4322-04]